MADWFSDFLKTQNDGGETIKNFSSQTEMPAPSVKLNNFIPDRPAPPAEPAGNINEALVKIIRAQRQIWAKEKGYPLYCIFSNDTIDAIAQYFPINLEDLGKIRGMGKTKISQYGEALIKIVADFAAKNGDITPLAIPTLVKSKKASKSNKKELMSIEAEKELELEIEDDSTLKYIKKLIKDGENVFVTGSAGTGKSFILNRLKKEFGFEVTSTTGMAAVNVGGQTIHAWSGAGICNLPLDFAIQNILKKSNLVKRIRNTKILAIDEISMLDAASFDYINNILKSVRASNLPFGGLQVVFFGDFFQLPPVDKTSGFCFESMAWKELNLKNVLLRKIYRQEDSSFAEILNDIRQNNFKDSDFKVFYSRNNAQIPDKKEILHIFATNSDADAYNEKKFNELDEKTEELLASDVLMKNEEADKIVTTTAEIDGLNERYKTTWSSLDKYCRAPQKLELKKGCRVMLLKNIDFDAGLINGSCGVVEGFDDGIINVKFDNGEFKSIKQFEFDYMKDGKIAARRVQYPFRLAYGITIHKSQGMTLEEVFIDFSRIFEYGQAYVALSRVKSLGGLYLKSFSPQKIMANPKIVEFYKQLEAECADPLFTLK